MRRKVVFIGNRPKVLEKLIENNNIEVIKAFVIEQPLIKDLEGLNIDRIPNKGYKKELVDFLKSTKFDICVSAGCSYILPRNELPFESLFINCHPSVLPLGKGIHPLNECFLSGNNIAGVTIHLLVDELDAGDILKQEKFELTDDIDLSVLYGFIFDLEAELLDATINGLIQNNMKFTTIPQKGKGTYYSREEERRVFNAKDTKISEFIKNTRAFSSTNLGVYLDIENLKILVFMAQEIKNSFLLNRYKKTDNGRIIFMNENVILAKLSDGIIKISKFNLIYNEKRK